jgi:CheY-like chemotaxis protein
MSNNETSALSRPLEGCFVLVVEDNDDARTLYATLLSMNGAHVTAVPSVADAINAIERASFDVVVSDVDMPDEDGYALIAKIRARTPEEGGQVPAIAVTGHGFDQDRERLLAAGFDDYLAKPVDANDLVERINLICGRSGPDAEP